MLSDGEATAGDTSAESITLLAADYGREGLGLTTMGVGERFDAPLMRRLAETGWGSFYFLDDPRAVTEVFTEEVTSFMIPLAQDVKISADIESGYNLRAVYGTKLEVTLNNETEISIPILQIAHRESANDTGKGRRGGGGAIILETIPNGGETAAVGNLRFEYSVPGTDERIIQRVAMNSPLRPGEVPEDGFFSGPQVAKAFVMLNIYAAFELAAVSADVREDAKAIAILEAARDGVLNWLASNDDRDIEDDVRYLDLFVANLRNRPCGVDDDNDDCCEDIDTWPHD